MKINFSSPGFEPNSNFYNLDWSNHSNFSWQAQVTGDYAPQYHELHHPEYLQFDDQSSHPSFYNQSAPQSVLEDTLKAFMHLTCQAISDMRNAIMANTQAIAKMEGQINYLVVEFNRIDDEEFQSQLMTRGHYMIDEDESNNSCHEHVSATTILKSEEIVDNNEEEEKEDHLESVEHLERIEPPSTPNLSNDKEMSTEPHSFIIIPFETLHEP
jgi:hypothetical protein